MTTQTAASLECKTGLETAEIIHFFGIRWISRGDVVVDPNRQWKEHFLPFLHLRELENIVVTVNHSGVANRYDMEM